MGSCVTQKLTDNELQCRILYAVVVAGKTAEFADRAMTQLHHLFLQHNCITWFEAIRVIDKMGKLLIFLTAASTGNYTKIERSFRELANCKIDLRICEPQDLEKCHGVGPKTSRFFILWTRPGARYAALDVHILRWLHEQGHANIPKNTPNYGVYKRIEKLFIDEADKLGLTPRELDWQIWENGSGYKGKVQAKV